jgi:CheY-like chemotaxis protein
VAAGRILIVDADPDSRSVYRIMLQHRGYEVAEVADGEAALHMVAETGWDAVVMELTLPAVDGHAVLERLVSEKPELCVVVLTARGLREDRARAERAGCRKYLTKPLQPQQLAQEIEKLLGGSSSRPEGRA